MIKCAREGCDIDFVKKTHNQKYHDDECCRLATNKRIMDNYYERKAQRSGTARYCSDCYKTKLSRYNNTSVCNSCKQAKEEAANRWAVNALLALSLH